MGSCWLRVLAVGLLVLPLVASASERCSTESTKNLPVAPFRVLDLTFPSFLVLDFLPVPAKTLGRGCRAWEFHYSVANDFQASPMVKQYLQDSRSRVGALSQEDAETIINFGEGNGFFIDGEFGAFDLGFHLGLSDQFDLSGHLRYLTYGGGHLDHAIQEFHDGLGLGQQGRDLVDPDHFQVVIGADGEGLVLLDRPTAGGFGDPQLFLRWSSPKEIRGWKFGMELGLKLPLADEEKLLSTGSFDYGIQLTAAKEWTDDTVIFNFFVVDAGRIRAEFDPGLIPSLSLSWIRSFKRFPRTHGILQLHMSEHILSDFIDSSLSEPEVQVTVGLKWQLIHGRFGMALTENLFNYDNTPDIALHLSWGYLLGGMKKK